MPRRRLTTFATAALFAVMVGIRESTGLAPPPPTLSTEEIEWLSPERPDAGGFYVVYEDPAVTAVGREAASPRPKRGVFSRLARALLGR